MCKNKGGILRLGCVNFKLACVNIGNENSLEACLIPWKDRKIFFIKIKNIFLKKIDFIRGEGINLYL